MPEVRGLQPGDEVSQKADIAADPRLAESKQNDQFPLFTNRQGEKEEDISDTKKANRERLAEALFEGGAAPGIRDDQLDEARRDVHRATIASISSAFFGLQQG